jgi:cytochrome c2
MPISINFEHLPNNQNSMKKTIFYGCIAGLFTWLAACSSGANDPNKNLIENTASEENGEDAKQKKMIQTGTALFQKQCTQCHYLTTEKLIGPGLKGVASRRDKVWLKSFIKNSEEMVKSGDSLAKALFEEYNKTPMPAHNFTEEELNALIAYLESNP